MADSIGSGISAGLGALGSESGKLVASVSDTFSQQASFESEISSLLNNISVSYEGSALDRMTVSEALKKSEDFREDLSNAKV